MVTDPLPACDIVHWSWGERERERELGLHDHPHGSWREWAGGRLEHHPRGSSISLMSNWREMGSTRLYLSPLCLRNQVVPTPRCYVTLLAYTTTAAEIRHLGDGALLRLLGLFTLAFTAAQGCPPCGHIMITLITRTNYKATHGYLANYGLDHMRDEGTCSFSGLLLR